MKINFNVEVDSDIIRASDFFGKVSLMIYPIQRHVEASKGQSELFIYFKGNVPILLSTNGNFKDSKVTRVVKVQGLKSVDESFALGKAILEMAAKGNLKVQSDPEIVNKENLDSQISKLSIHVLTVLKAFGFLFKKVKPAFAKAQHRWNKDVSSIVFTIDYHNAKGQAIWKKRNQMVLLKGAKLDNQIPLNKDGSVGFAARLAQKLRSDNASAIDGDKTTQDIVLKSVNEVGTLLYFAGTNSWKILKDGNGKTIDEYTVVK